MVSKGDHFHMVLGEIRRAGQQRKAEKAFSWQMCLSTHSAKGKYPGEYERNAHGPSSSQGGNGNASACGDGDSSLRVIKKELLFFQLCDPVS